MLVALSPATVATQTNPAGITINPLGTYAYVANYGDNGGGNTISMYSISESGLLVPLAESTVATGDSPEQLTFN